MDKVKQILCVRVPQNNAPLRWPKLTRLASAHGSKEDETATDPNTAQTTSSANTSDLTTKPTLDHGVGGGVT